MRSATVRAATCVELQVLSRADFDDIFRDYPACLAELRQMAMKRVHDYSGDDDGDGSGGGGSSSGGQDANDADDDDDADNGEAAALRAARLERVLDMFHSGGRLAPGSEAEREQDRAVLIGIDEVRNSLGRRGGGRSGAPSGGASEHNSEFSDISGATSVGGDRFDSAAAATGNSQGTGGSNGGSSGGSGGHNNGDGHAEQRHASVTTVLASATDAGFRRDSAFVAKRAHAGLFRARSTGLRGGVGSDVSGRGSFSGTPTGTGAGSAGLASLRAGAGASSGVGGAAVATVLGGAGAATVVAGASVDGVVRGPGFTSVVGGVGFTGTGARFVRSPTRRSVFRFASARVAYPQQSHQQQPQQQPQPSQQPQQPTEESHSAAAAPVQIELSTMAATAAAAPAATTLAPATASAPLPARASSSSASASSSATAVPMVAASLGALPMLPPLAANPLFAHAHVAAAASSAAFAASTASAAASTSPTAAAARNAVFLTASPTAAAAAAAAASNVNIALMAPLAPTAALMACSRHPTGHALHAVERMAGGVSSSSGGDRGSSRGSGSVGPLSGV